MARRPRGTEARRGELLEAAGRLFVREGFASVSVSRIVREVGVAQGTFYYYFASPPWPARRDSIRGGRSRP